jgi:hypothetical protein
MTRLEDLQKSVFAEPPNHALSRRLRDLRQITSTLQKSKMTPLQACEAIIEARLIDLRTRSFFLGLPEDEKHYWIASLYALLMPKARSQPADRRLGYPSLPHPHVGALPDFRLFLVLLVSFPPSSMEVFQDRGSVIVVFDKKDLQRLAKGANFMGMLREKYERVRPPLASRDPDNKRRHELETEVVARRLRFGIRFIAYPPKASYREPCSESWVGSQTSSRLTVVNRARRSSLKERRARLALTRSPLAVVIAFQKNEKRARMDSFFDRTRRELGFLCRCWCRHRCTSSDDGITDGNRTERESTRSWRPSWFAQGLMAFERRNLDARS